MKRLEDVTAVFLDADDTLWENNMFFLQCIEWLSRTGRSMGFTDKAVLTVLDSWEKRHIRLMGYGYASFEESLLATVRQLSLTSRYVVPHHAGLRLRALKWTRFLRNHPMVLMPGVRETLPRIAARYRTIIVTKGNHDDQMSKVHRSGLLPAVEGVEVVHRKNVQEYVDVLAKYGLAPEEVVMVGNSPASDVNPPKRAGMRTVFVPHPKTWHFEVEHIQPGGPETVRIAHFAALAGVLGLDA